MAGNLCVKPPSSLPLLFPSPLSPLTVSLYRYVRAPTMGVDPFHFHWLSLKTQSPFSIAAQGKLNFS
jgi:hypothetical protein